MIPIYIWGIAREEFLELKVWFTMRLQGNLSLKISEKAYYQLRNIIFATTISFSKVAKGDLPFFGQLWLSPESTWWTAGIFPGYRTVKTPCCSQQVVPAWPPFWTRKVTLVPGLCSRQVASVTIAVTGCSGPYIGCKYLGPLRKEEDQPNFPWNLQLAKQFYATRQVARQYKFTSNFVSTGGGGGALSYISYIHVGMCGAKGMAFRADLVWNRYRLWPSWSEIGLGLSNVVLNWLWFLEEVTFYLLISW